VTQKSFFQLQAKTPGEGVADDRGSKLAAFLEAFRGFTDAHPIHHHWSAKATMADEG
jgi:hypothetical protein